MSMYVNFRFVVASSFSTKFYFCCCFYLSSQQDAQEFLICLLEGLHEDVNLVQEKKKRVIDDSNEVESIR